MGATNYSGVWKNCATCEHWSGVRKALPTHDGVAVDSSMVGVCSGFWKGSRKYGNDKCGGWAKWSQITEKSPEREIN